MPTDSGAPASRTGSHEPSPAVSALTGFDPSRTHLWDETEWHAFVQWIAHHWHHPEEVAIAYQAAGGCAKILRAEMERRDRNENRNCINWGPCSRHDGRMCDSDASLAEKPQALSPEGVTARANGIAQDNSHA